MSGSVAAMFKIGSVIGISDGHEYVYKGERTIHINDTFIGNLTKNGEGFKFAIPEGVLKKGSSNSIKINITIFKATAGRSRSDNMDYYERESEVMAEEKEWFINKGSGWEPE